MSEADKRAREQAKQEWDMRRFHRQPKEKKKRRRSSEGEEDGDEKGSESEGCSPRSGSPRSVERSKSKEKRRKEDGPKANKAESPRFNKTEKEGGLRIIRPVSQKTDIRIEASFLKAERVRPNRNVYTT